MSTNNAIAVTLRARAQAAFERLSSACPEDAGIVGKYLAALHGKNVIALDEGEAFVLTDSGGRQIKATKRTVRLSVENGGLVQPVFNGPYVISAPGYGMLARAAGAVVMNAPTVTVDGVMQQNPYVRRGPDGTVLEVHCRSTAFRYNENGQPVVSDRTTVFDTGTYTLSDMVGKAKKHKEAFRLLPAAFPAPEPPEQWACYRVDEAINLWMKITHDEVLIFLGQVLNRKKKALEFAALRGTETVIDAYCGTGTIGIFAAKHAKTVVGVELNGDAVADARENARRNGIQNIRFIEADAGEFLTGMATAGERADVVFLDPPRAGSSLAFLRSLVSLAPARVVYISCNPETQQRDLLYLCKHGYRVRKIQPVDMFPRTNHVETVALLTRKQARLQSANG